MPNKLLEGRIVDAPDPRDAEIERLKRELRQANAEKNAAEVRATNAEEEVDALVAPLRQVLTPIHQALKIVFREMDAVDGGGSSTGASGDGGAQSETVERKAYWAEWKERLGPSCAKVIDLLLLQGSATVINISTAVKMSTKTVYIATSKMGRSGILQNSGGKFSLKRPE